MRRAFVFQLGAAFLISAVALADSGRQSSQPARWLVLNTSPASVVAVDPATLGVAAKADLACAPTYVLRSKSRDRVYVLCNGALDMAGKRLELVSELIVLDGADLRIKARTSLGWRVHKMLLSEDERYLVTLTARKSPTKKEPEVPPIATVFDTGTLTAIGQFPGPAVGATAVEWFFGAEGSGLIVTRDLSRLFVFDEGRVDEKERQEARDSPVRLGGRAADRKEGGGDATRPAPDDADAVSRPGRDVRTGRCPATRRTSSSSSEPWAPARRRSSSTDW